MDLTRIPSIERAAAASDWARSWPPKTTARVPASGCARNRFGPTVFEVQHLDELSGGHGAIASRPGDAPRRGTSRQALTGPPRQGGQGEHRRRWRLRSAPPHQPAAACRDGRSPLRTSVLPISRTPRVQSCRPLPSLRWGRPPPRRPAAKGIPRQGPGKTDLTPLSRPSTPPSRGKPNRLRWR